MDDIDRIARGAQASQLQIAVAESLTCGRLASTIGAGDGASEWFKGGVVAYQTDIKEQLLGVRDGVDPCSAECARQLAAGTRRLLQADVAVSVTGVGGPDAEDGHAPGTVYVGWSVDGETDARRFSFDGDPGDVLDASVDAALGILSGLVQRNTR